MPSADQRKPQRVEKTEFYFVLEIAYDRKLLLPFDEGIEFMKTLKEGIVIQGYSGIKEITPAFKSLTFSIMSAQDLKQIELENAISPED
jgi:hypothetical protein